MFIYYFIYFFIFIFEFYILYIFLNESAFDEWDARDIS